ncbi:MAG: hypothetical protein MZV64_25855 [Ignavibacteriales bacterium]|nr:hypothetical protein [Ignavibacteriales bacterium]
MALLYLHRNEHTTLLYLPFLKRAVIDLGWFYAPFAVLLLTWYSNAVNLTDGLDGLATGLVILVGVSALAVLAYVTGQCRLGRATSDPLHQAAAGRSRSSASPWSGASVGFLWFNAHPARGLHGRHGQPRPRRGARRRVADHQEGGAAARPRRRVRHRGAVRDPPGGVVQARPASAVFRMAPLHHHFELSGWPESRVVTRFWILGALFALLGLSTLKIQ